jgi:uncharacterized membrane protein
MRRVDEQIDVHVSAALAYEQWARFEDHPKFAAGVVEVRRRDDRLLWIRTLAGRRRAWEARIVAEQPARRLSWVAPEGPLDTDLRFEALGPAWSRIHLRERIHHALLLEASAVLGLATRRARADLRRFKALVEDRR